ncbi:MAG: hypothetical protein IH948_08815 [Bacteroidetes bacterium]|nr:hypothetical protein [Bacteroidota bacterium]
MLKEIAKNGRTNPYYLSKYILGHDRFEEEPHQELTNYLLESKRRTSLILMPRGSFKSTAVTVGYSIYSMLQNPDVRILISSETQSNAIKFVTEIRTHLEGNMRFKKLYGSWENKGSWKSNEFIIRPRKKTRKEPTVTAGSLEKGTQVGMHYDIIILDDVVSINNINSNVQIQKTIDHYKLLLSILEPGGKIIVVGTRWGFWELYAYLLDKDGPEFSQVDFFYRSAEDSDGNPLMPKILSRDFLAIMKRSQGNFIYSCQYRNRPESNEDATFKVKDIQYYLKLPGNLNYFLTVDPSIGQTKRSDYSGVILNGVDYFNNWYIIKAMQLKVTLSELINIIFQINDEYPLSCLGMEKFHLEKILQQTLHEEMIKRNKSIPIKEVETASRISKEARIASLQPLVAGKRLHVLKEHIELVNQIVNFPMIKYDDLIDALKSQLQIVYPHDQLPTNYNIKKEDTDKLSAFEKVIWDDVKSYGKRRTVKQTNQYL